MNFLTMQQELADRVNLDQTVTANATRLKRWLNMSQQDIASRRDWRFLEERATVQTSTQYTTGTVTVTNGSATVTGSGTVWTSALHLRSFIQFQASNDWYEITAVAGNTSMTISPVFGGTTASAQTYTITKVFYSLGTDVHKLIDVRQFSTPQKLTNLGNWTMDLYRPDLTQTVSVPRAYATFRQDPTVASTAAKSWQLQFFPIPDAVYNMECRYLKILTDLSGDTDISQIPAPFHPIMVDGAESLAMKFLSDPREEGARMRFEQGLARMIAEESALGDWMPVVQPSDANVVDRTVRFPAQFQQPYSE